MANLITFVLQLLLSPPKYLRLYLKSIFCYSKLKKCSIIVIIIVCFSSIIATGILLVSVYKPYKTAYINRDFNKITAIERIKLMMEQLTSSCGQGVTASLMVLSSNLDNYKKILKFAVVKTCDFKESASKEDCLIDSIRRNPGFYEKEYPLSERDGELIESDIFELGYIEYSFKELEVITIPVYENKAISPQMISLKFKAPELYRLLTIMPLPLRKVKFLFVAKARDITQYNTLVTYLVLFNKWGDEQDGCNQEGLKQSAGVLIQLVKDLIPVI